MSHVRNLVRKRAFDGAHSHCVQTAFCEETERTAENRFLVKREGPGSPEARQLKHQGEVDV